MDDTTLVDSLGILHTVSEATSPVMLDITVTTLRYNPTVNITLHIVTHGSRHYFLRPLCEIINDPFAITFSFVAKPSILWHSEQGRYMELCLPGMYFKSSFHSGLRSKEALQETHKVFLLQSW
ncbi:hypothetical protein AA0117_g13191 [Alternaria alternata]|jgi:hypothetical protein|uniref:Uncharacterized protein n=1 Tax=Alternaria alternata TaxID=5599 RepID=A0A4Q4MRD9_ALTAL|nr:hypothetical protein AA0117_g13191 [Alternaria alternata]